MAKNEKVSDMTKELGAAGSLGHNPTVGEQQSVEEQQGGEGRLGHGGGGAALQGGRSWRFMLVGSWVMD